MFDKSLEDMAKALHAKRPWGGKFSTDLDWALEEYLLYCRTLDAPQALPIKRDEMDEIIEPKNYYLVKSAIENVPRLESIGISEITINCFVSFLFDLVAFRAYLPRILPTKEQIANQELSLEYARTLTRDAISLYERGLSEEGIQTYIELATRACFIGRIEDGGLSEIKRMKKYDLIMREILEKIDDASMAKDTKQQLFEIFERIVYADTASGLMAVSVFGRQSDGKPHGVYREI